MAGNGIARLGRLREGCGGEGVGVGGEVAVVPQVAGVGGVGGEQFPGVGVDHGGGVFVVSVEPCASVFGGEDGGVWGQVVGVTVPAELAGGGGQPSGVVSAG